MKILLLKTYRNHKAGREWNCPLASQARKLIEEGVALAIEPCDLHLNPPTSETPASDPNASERPASNDAASAPAESDTSPSQPKPKRKRKPK